MGEKRETNPDGIGKPMQQDQQQIDDLRERQQEEQHGDDFKRLPGERKPGPQPREQPVDQVDDSGPRRS